MPEHEIISFETLDSTNEQLKRMIDTAQNGLVVSALEQTAGKGRLSRRWLSEKGSGAWLSLMVKDARLKSEGAAGLVFVCALAAVKSLRKLCKRDDIYVKWPNDIVTGGRKLAGILCESGFDGDRLMWSVCGIGINLTTTEFPQELPWATSVYRETGLKLEIPEVIGEFLRKFDSAFELMLSQGLKAVLGEIKPLSATLGRTVTARFECTTVTGTATDFGDDGALIILSGDKTYHVNVGDVSVRGLMGYI